MFNRLFYYLLYIYYITVNIYLENQIFITQKRKREKNNTIAHKPQLHQQHNNNSNNNINNTNGQIDEMIINNNININNNKSNNNNCSSNTSTTTIVSNNNNINNGETLIQNNDTFYNDNNILNNAFITKQSKSSHTFITSKVSSSLSSSAHKKKQELTQSPVKSKTCIITHQNYIATKSSQDFMTYNFNLEFNIDNDNSDCDDNSYDEYKQHINKDKLNKTLILDDKIVLPKRIWNNSDVNQNELSKAIASFEKKWPRKIVDFNEELALQILKMCKFDYKKCETYIGSKEFKTLLIKLKKKNGSSSLECIFK